MTALGLATAAAGCGGGGAFGNSPDVSNPPAVSGQKLSFEYFQRCVNPVLVAPLQVPGGGTQSCASSGCHDDANGTGGAFRMVAGAALVTPASDPAAVRATDMYKNFFSAMGSSVIGAPSSSRMVNKPLVRGVLHGGGVIFASDTDPNLKRIEYWVSKSMPDEFSGASAGMFTPPDPATGTCNTQ
ncbi:MAG TPA: hypothetical protein VFQ20_06780 [Burkholderiaceae bacterium]|nr:hypothetical protein [Burkholderiaceae bacterium]